MRRGEDVGTGAYAPQRILTNADLERYVRRTSVDPAAQRDRERPHRGHKEATSDLAVHARVRPSAGEMTRRTSTHRGGHDHAGLFFPSRQHRSASPRLQARGLVDCSRVRRLRLQPERRLQVHRNGKYRRVLCIGAETLSRITVSRIAERGAAADAAGAAVLEASRDGSGIIDTDLYSDGQYWPPLHAGRRRAQSRDTRTVDARMPTPR